MLFLHVTTRVEGDKYQELLQEKGGRGFPHLAFLDANGAVLAVHEGPRTVDGFRETGASAKKFIALKAKAATGAPADKVEFFMAGLGIGYFDAEAASAQLAELKSHMSEEQIAKVGAKLVGMEIEGALNSINSREEMLAAGKRFAEMAAAGKVPADDEGFAPYFWIFQLEHADSADDLKGAEAAVAEMKKRFAGPQYGQLLEQVGSKLEELRTRLAEDKDGEGDGGK